MAEHHSRTLLRTCNIPHPLSHRCLCHWLQALSLVLKLCKNKRYDVAPQKREAPSKCPLGPSTIVLKRYEVRPSRRALAPESPHLPFYRTINYSSSKRKCWCPLFMCIQGERSWSLGGKKIINMHSFYTLENFNSRSSGRSSTIGFQVKDTSQKTRVSLIAKNLSTIKQSYPTESQFYFLIGKYNWNLWGLEQLEKYKRSSKPVVFLVDGASGCQQRSINNHLAL